MISDSIYYYRQVNHDIPTLSCPKASRVQNVLMAALSLVSFIRPARAPLSIGLGALRSISHLQSIFKGVQEKDFATLSIDSIRLLLSLAAVAIAITALATPHLNPSMSLLLSGTDDLIGNILELIKAVEAEDKKQSIEVLSHLISSLLYMAFILFGHIEIVATCMLLQVLFNLHKAIDECKEGRYLEAACHVATSVLTLSQLVPQMKVIVWKWKTHPVLEGQLCRDARGFVYVKVRDEVVLELNKVFGDSALPPYFGEGKAGAHITVIPVGELGKDIPISELGKTIQFTIAFFDSLKPQNFKGVSEVSFLSLCAPDLDAFRSKYGLTAKVHGNHNFHITFGVKYEN